jgi:hypothetical protein
VIGHAPETFCLGPSRLLAWRRCRSSRPNKFAKPSKFFTVGIGPGSGNLVRLPGDLDLAEESMHEAFATALESRPETGVPDNPRPWLISTARFKAIDRIRRRARFDGVQSHLIAHLESRGNQAPLDDQEIEDDRLRLIFTCCHPALSPEAQVALTLREVCGLTTEVGVRSHRNSGSGRYWRANRGKRAAATQRFRSLRWFSLVAARSIPRYDWPYGARSSNFLSQMFRTEILHGSLSISKPMNPGWLFTESLLSSMNTAISWPFMICIITPPRAMIS